MRSTARAWAIAGAWTLAATAIGLGAGAARAAFQTQPGQAGWVELFDGKTLNGWTPKIAGYSFGEDPKRRFRAENGTIRVVYGPDEEFTGDFGHLFYKSPFSKYVLQLEYRFVGEQAKNGPGWAWRNSGVMIHCQDPKTMSKDQSFPVSAEVQFLGGPAEGERSTGNLCTPGTHVVIDGKLVTAHCINSTSPTLRGDQWVKAEIEVNGHGIVRHVINGQEVFRYEQVQLDDTDADAKALLAAGAKPKVDGGWISLQAESHPVEFRNIRIRELR